MTEDTCRKLVMAAWIVAVCILTVIASFVVARC